MTFNTHRSQIRTIRPNDPRFHISDGIVTAARAGFEISIDCPNTYAEVIKESVRQGWLKPVAAVTERELIFIGLSDD